ncbi:bile acid 7-alpha-dehydratase [Rhizobium sp. TH135]|uniref:nuclear transport factor 2 family protein n=1 Tax=Rhizobium sp. TH135 TaxID=2067451 RepID=UPI000C7B70B1|nr:nuclear transport factor 2 family protein [Rhizobium sp. TH135]PLK73145.1 bile acid 7-alpha-dehydratase [Rhizobium sp. TH135]
MAAASLEDRIRYLEDIAELKRLVDTFSNLADDRKVREQTFLFTEDGIVETWFGETPLPPLKGRKQIEESWTPFLAGFEAIYHMNGQFVADIKGDEATAVHYCTVELISSQGGSKVRNSNGVIYNDSYVRQDGKWLIAKRVARFTWRDMHPFTPA